MWEDLLGRRIVVDTNVFVSFLIASEKTRNLIKNLLEYIFDNSTLLFSAETFSELEEILLRSKFRKYFSKEDAQHFLTAVTFLSTFVEIKEKINASRDPNDNKILEAAINGRADLIISGDKDLLEMKRFQGIKIVSPSNFHLPH